jgi:acetoin utilization protein AcuB
MKLRELMRGPVLTARPAQPAEEAFERMRARGVRHLVVLRGREVVGILSERDLGGERGRNVRLGQAVGELMSGCPIVAEADLEVARAAAILRRRRLGCLPVLEGGKLVGIVTRSDLVGLLHRAPKPTARQVPKRRRPTARG